LVDECFEHTPSRINGASYEEIARDVLRFHAAAYPEYSNGDGAKSDGAKNSDKLENFAFLRYRKDGEQHAFTPSWFKPFHKAVRENDFEGQYKIFANAVNTREKPVALRDLLEWKPLGPAVPLEQVEPVEAIF